MISTDLRVRSAYFYQPAVTAEFQNEAKEAERLTLPGFSIYDQPLLAAQKKGVADNRGVIKGKRFQNSLPSLPEEEASDILRMFRMHHTMLTTDKSRFFTLALPELLQAVLTPLNISYTTRLTGGAIFSFFDEKYIKETLGKLHPDLFDSIPEKCLQFNKNPNDYDFRIYLNCNLTYNDFNILKNNIINVFVHSLYGNNPFDPVKWQSLYDFVLKNCFVKLKIEFSNNNRFLITTFSDGRLTIDLLWFASLERHYLFTDNSLSHYIPNSGNRQDETALITPFAETGNAYQAVYDKIAKVIRAPNLRSINYKGWFALIQKQTVFYRCYEERLEQTLLETTLKHPIRNGEDPAEWLDQVLKQCLHDHVDKSNDPIAVFCLVFSACRSLHQLGYPQLALKLYQKSEASFPNEGLPSLIGSSFAINLSLLQIFGLLTLDGERICYTLNEFKPALQFVLQGRTESFTLLIPLEIESVISTLQDHPETDRYFDHFFSSIDSHFSTKPLNIKLPELGDLDTRLRYYLFVWDCLQKRDYTPVQKVLTAFIKNYADRPSDHMIRITELFLQGFLNDPSFAFEREVCFPLSYARALFSQNNPILAHQAHLFWNEQKQEAGHTEKLLSKMPISYRLKQLKLLQKEQSISKESQVAQITPLINLVVNKPEGITYLHACATFISEISGFVEGPSAAAIALLVNHYLNTFGFHSDIQSLLLKMAPEEAVTRETYLKIGTQFPGEVEKILGRGKEQGVFTESQDANLLSQIILSLIDQGKNMEASRLITLLNRKLIGKLEQKQINQFIEGKLADPALWLFELDRLLQERQFACLPKYLAALLPLDLEEKNKEQLLKLARQILALSKQPDLSSQLLLHPKIYGLLPHKEILQAIVTYKTPELLKSGIENFPSGDSATDRAFVELLIKKNTVHPKITPFIFECGDSALIEKWLDLLAPPELSQELLQKHLNLLDPTASPRIRRYTQKETLKTLAAEYSAYIPTVSNAERFAWVCLILEAKLSSLYPVFSWIEGLPLTEPFLTLCTPDSFEKEEIPKLQALLRSSSYATFDLSSAASLFRRFEILDEGVLRAFLNQALNKSSDKLKMEMWIHFEMQPVNCVECWILAIKLLKRIKSERLFDFIKKPSPLPQVSEEIAEGVALIIKNPINEVQRIQSLLEWRDSHNLEDNAEIIKLCARSKDQSLLMSAAARLRKLLERFPAKQPELLPVLEYLLTNMPVNGGGDLLYSEINAILEHISKEKFDHNFILTLIRSLCAVQKDEFLIEACEFIYYLLENKTTQGSKEITAAVKLCINAKNKELHREALVLLRHPHFVDLVKDNGPLYIDLTKKLLMLNVKEESESIIDHTLLLFYQCLPHLYSSPKDRETMLPLFFDYLFCIPDKSNVSYYLFQFFKHLSKKKPEMTLQEQNYYTSLGYDITKNNSQKNKPQDVLFDTVCCMLTSLMKHSSSLIDADPHLYKYVYLHLYNLLEHYPNNGQKTTPLLHNWLTLQFPSGIDLSTQALIESSKLITKASVIPSMFKNQLEKLYELAFLNAVQMSHTSNTLSLKQKAFETIVCKLTAHPSQSGPFRACQTIEKNAAFFCIFDKATIDKLLDQLEKSVLRDPSFLVVGENITQQYLCTIVSLINHMPALKIRITNFFPNLIHSLKTRPREKLATEALHLVDLLLVCSTPINDYVQMTEILGLIGEFLIENAHDTPVLYKQVSQILHVSLNNQIKGYDRTCKEKLTEKILASLRQASLPGLKELLVGENNILKVMTFLDLLNQ